MCFVLECVILVVRSVVLVGVRVLWRRGMFLFGCVPERSSVGRAIDCSVYVLCNGVLGNQLVTSSILVARTLFCHPDLGHSRVTRRTTDTLFFAVLSPHA